jgi:alpha-glucoside transport system permease protein
MKSFNLKKQIGNLPTHFLLIGFCFLWLLPTFGLLVTSFRPFQDVNDTGWWTVLSPAKGATEYTQFCAECHGSDGKKIGQADLSDKTLIEKYKRSFALLAVLKKDLDGEPHMGSKPIPNDVTLAAIATYTRRISGIDTTQTFTLNNYIDTITGYRGTETYTKDCAAGTQALDLYCDWRDLGNSRGMGRSFINSLFVSIPSTVFPILFAAFAAYAFAWMNFRGRNLLFAVLVGVQVVPLQMALIPISRLYSELGLNGTFWGIWLFHTGFGLPYAIYLMRNFIGTLPRELFESAYLDGASHWTIFYKIVIRLSLPVIASLAIFQFLWIWNDLLVALVFLGGQTPVMTYQIANMVTSHGSGWHLLTAAAFISMALPLCVFFGFQKYFVHGMLSGSVKG